MPSLNKVQLIGNLGQDPETKYGQKSGHPYTFFSLATQEWDGEKEVPEWHRIVCFKKAAEIAGDFLRKGRLVYVEGRLRTRKWKDLNEIERSTTEIIASRLLILSPKKENEPHEDHAPGESAVMLPTEQDPFSGDFDFPAINDDDLPF